MILALDLASVTGWCTSNGAEGVLNLTPKPPTKGKPGKPAKYHKRTGALLRPAIDSVPGRMPEPDDERLWKLWTFLSWQNNEQAISEVVHEAPLRHHASQNAAKCAHEFQAVVKLWCRFKNIPRRSIEPLELQRFALGKKADTEANEMLHAARARLGYTGNDHNIADAKWIMRWALQYPLSPKAVGA